MFIQMEQVKIAILFLIKGQMGLKEKVLQVLKINIKHIQVTQVHQQEHGKIYVQLIMQVNHIFGIDNM